jgi:hypothetical protein
MAQADWKALAPAVLVAGLTVARSESGSVPADDVSAAPEPAGTAGAPATGPGEAAPELEPPLGTWSFSIPPATGVTLRFGADGIMTLAESRFPTTTPAGGTGCNIVPRWVFSATYSTSVADGRNTLSWTPTEGKMQGVSRCQDPSLDAGGAWVPPASVESVIASNVAQGIFPPRTVSFALTQGLLELNPDLQVTRRLDGFARLKRLAP